ncbi:uncharacterized protein J4E88_008598 [Alternaria novae-zelandiae]|uniref:uncharacterized protein n=1 Tax=Alternaria novae-zelandiae TaxID=430562 RepID=UPI0020C2D50F|nr:uncharacterized protein J4E88_008598 [Alternaria novae-zelandiae]KAI4673543.1 hypothetical protein J4E88_008598 [Alternaria novae-zelandiae]
MHNRKTYFILSTTDYDTKHIQLGQIITNIRIPYRALSPPLNTSESPLPEIESRFKENYTFDHARAVSGALGVQAQFLAQLGSPLGADAEMSREHVNSVEWGFERLDTKFIEPTHKYVEDSVRLVPEVKNWLDKRRLSGAAYMVTGVKIARGVRFTGKKVRKVGLGGAATVDLMTLTGAPMSGGPTGSVEKSEEAIETYTKCSDFVWAYRIQRVYVSWFGGVVKTKEKVGGDLAGAGNNRDYETYSEESEDETQEMNEVELENDMGSDMVPSGFLEAKDISGLNVGEDNEAFLCQNM